MINVKKFIFNPFQENTYVVWDDISREGAVVDPGCSNKNEEDEMFNFISDHNVNLKYLINTHCHIDHVLGNKAVKEKFKLPFYGPELDVPLLNNVVAQAEMFGIQIEASPPIDQFITENLKLKLGQSTISFLFTPGHTPGEYCLLFEGDKILLSGDVLFFQGIGRTDLPGGDYETLMQSITTKIFSLDESIIVYPGHGDKTEIGFEKNNNPFFR